MILDAGSAAPLPTTRRCRMAARRRWPRRRCRESTRPPGRCAGATPPMPRAVQSIVRPVPPRRTGSCASSRIIVGAGHCVARQGRRTSHRHRFQHRPAEPRRVAGDLVAVQLHHAEPDEGGDLVDVLGRLVDEHADRRDKRRQPLNDRARARPDRCTAGSPARTRSRCACAPQSTATSASSRRVMPQIFTSMPVPRETGAIANFPDTQLVTRARPRVSRFTFSFTPNSLQCFVTVHISGTTKLTKITKTSR